jgi:hypothetical protein
MWCSSLRIRGIHRNVFHFSLKSQRLGRQVGGRRRETAVQTVHTLAAMASPHIQVALHVIGLEIGLLDIYVQ